MAVVKLTLADTNESLWVEISSIIPWAIKPHTLVRSTGNIQCTLLIHPTHATNDWYIEGEINGCDNTSRTHKYIFNTCGWCIKGKPEQVLEQLKEAGCI